MAKKIYIAGPMTGYPNWNHDAFNRAAYEYRRRGYTVYNPAEVDVGNGIDIPEDGDTAVSISTGSLNMREVYLKDIQEVVTGDAIHMLKGWEFSPGACGEHAAAVAMKKHYPSYEIFYE